MSAEKRLAPFLEIIGWIFLVGGLLICLSTLQHLGEVMPQACLSEMKYDNDFVVYAIGSALSLFMAFSGLLFVRGARKVRKRDD